MSDTTTVEKLIYQIEVDDRDGSKTFDAWDKRLKSSVDLAKVSFAGLGKSLLGAVGNAVTKLSESFVDLGKSAVTNAIDLQDAMNGVKRTANLTTPDIEKLTGAVRDYSTNVLKGHGSSLQLAEALEIAGQQGIRGQENMLAFAGTMVKASVALDGLNLQKASERLGIFHGVFTDTIPTIENAASVLNHFGNTTKRGANFILDLASKMAGAAENFGLTEQETLALAAALGAVPQVASASGRAFSRVMSSLRTNTLEWGEALGFTTEESTKWSKLMREDASAALEVFGKRINELTKTNTGTDKLLQAFKDMRFTGDGVRAVLLGLGSEVDNFTKFLGQSNEEWEKNTSLQNEFESSTERVSSAFGSLQEVWGNTIGMLGDVLLPHIETFLIKVKEIVVSFRNWMKASGFLTDVLPGVFREINDVLLMILNRVVDISKNIDWSDVFTKVGSAIQAVWEKAKALIEALATGDIQKQWEDLRKAIKTISTVINAVATVLSALWDIALPGISEFIESIQYAIETIKEMNSIWDVITGTIKIFANTAKNAIQGVIGVVGTLINKLWEATKAVVGLDKEAVSESTFPDMHKWIQRNIEDVNVLTSSIGKAAQQTAGLGREVERVGGFGAGPGSVSGGTFRQPVTSSATTSTSTTPSTPPPAPTGNNGTTVVFQGTNIVDESSKNRFVRAITTSQQNLRAHVVFGG